jgi:class 3 adenylate cyclase
MTERPEPGAGSAEDRLVRLIDRLLITMEAASSSGAWGRVIELADDVLAADPANRRAAELLARARAEQSLSAGQRAFVTLIFSDIVRSTNLAELTEPEIMHDVFTRYRGAATAATEELDGRVLQFQGDGVVACFGYPNVHEDDARRAVLAGLGLVERMEVTGVDLRNQYGIDVAIRVGVHSGTVMVTGLASGPDAVDASDIVGSAANVAARLQAQAEPGTVVIGDATKHLVENHFDLVSVGTRVLSGIARPMEVFRVLRPSHLRPTRSPGRLQSHALVGRDGESAHLRRAWDDLLASAA